jgi:hypothetical protein
LCPARWSNRTSSPSTVSSSKYSLTHHVPRAA